MLDLLTCYSGLREQKPSVVLGLSGWRSIEEGGKPTAKAGKSPAPRTLVLPPVPHLLPSTPGSVSQAPCKGIMCTTYCPHVLQSLLSFNSLYLGACEFWKLKLLEQRYLGSSETEVGSPAQRGLGPWLWSPEK